MILTFTENGWEDYLYWQKTDKRILEKIIGLIKEIQRTPFEGTGRPEQLKYDLAGYWSRKIGQEHRFIYQVKKDEVKIYACRYHYD